MFLSQAKKAINSKINYIVNRQHRSSQTSFSYMQLSNLFKQDHFIPMTSWSMSPNLILHVLNDIEINNRTCIVEFGAGVSTLYIAKLNKIRGRNVKFYCIESDKEWIKKIEKQLLDLDLADFVTIILAPKQQVSDALSFKDQKLWYDSEILAKAFLTLEDIDLVLVDGPSCEKTPYCRYSAVPFISQKLARSFSIFLDDTNRHSEKEIAFVWQNELNCNLRSLAQYAHLSTVNSYGFLPLQI